MATQTISSNEGNNLDNFENNNNPHELMQNLQITETQNDGAIENIEEPPPLEVQDSQPVQNQENNPRLENTTPNEIQSPQQQPTQPQLRFDQVYNEMI